MGAVFGERRVSPFQGWEFLRGDISRGVAPDFRIFAPLGLPGAERWPPGHRASGSRVRSVRGPVTERLPGPKRQILKVS